MESIPKQIRIPKTLDVEAVERELAALWKETAEVSDGEAAVLRARAANLMVFLGDERALAETTQNIADLASIHPCRALVMAGDRNAVARDIEIYVSAFCQSEKRAGSKRLCCEEVTLTARGEFVSELPSAAIPLLVPDLPIFLWWRDTLRPEDKVFKTLMQAADRLVIDSADFQSALSDVAALTQLLPAGHAEGTAISDINWARLNSWRESLANFYDVAEHREELNAIDRLRIQYVDEDSPGRLPSAPFLIAAWLAGRLGWQLGNGTEERRRNGRSFLEFTREGEAISLELNPVKRPAMKPGRLTQIELHADSPLASSFVVTRSEDGVHLETTVRTGSHSYPSRMVKFRNQNTAQLLSGEMEILCNDRIYEEATRLAARIVDVAS